MILGVDRQSRTDALGSPGAEDGDDDNDNRKDQKEHVAGEGDRLGAGDDRRLHEGMHAVQERSAGSDAKGVHRRPCAALREQTQPNEKNQVDGEDQGDGAPVPQNRRDHNGCAEKECGDAGDPGRGCRQRLAGRIGRRKRIGRRGRGGRRERGGLITQSGRNEEGSDGENDDEHGGHDELRGRGAERVVMERVSGVAVDADGEEDGGD